MARPAIKHLLALLVATATLPTVAFSAYLFSNSLERERQIAVERLSTHNDMLVEAVDLQLSLVARILETLAEAPSLATGNLTDFHRQASQIGNGPTAVDAFVLFDADGRTVMMSGTPPGTRLAAFPAAMLERALATDRPALSTIHGAALGTRYVISLMRKVTVRDRPMVLAATIAARRFDRLIASAPGGWVAAMLDGQGNIISRQPGAEEFRGKPVIASLLAALENTQRGMLRVTTRDGVDTLASFKRSPTFGWVAVAGVPMTSIEGDVHRKMAPLGALGLALVAPGMMVAVWIGIRLARSMQNLSRLAVLAERQAVPGAPTPMACAELEAVATTLARTARAITERDALLIAERDAAELRRDELDAKTAELERSNADLEQFAYVASHDLREPSRTINSFLALLARKLGDSLDAEAREFIGFAQDAARRMDQMILDLLEYSRVGKACDCRETVSLAKALETALVNLASRIEESGARITTPEGDIRLQGSMVEIVRLLQNLIGNAIKYRAPERPLEIAIQATLADDGFCEISVTDNGIGIPAGYHDRIFKIFQRLHTSVEIEGTGIGLSICRKIVEHHGGRIRVESEEGAGTTFRFNLPLAEA